MLLSIIFNWGFALLIAKTNSADAKKIILWFAVTLNVGFLVYFKYATFIASSVGYDFEDSIPLPLGISFFTFHALSYVIDVYRGISLPQKSIINLGLYISNFPQLIAGPIIRYPDVGSQLTNRGTSVDDFAYGIRRFIIGLGKKVLIANNVAIAADTVFDLSPGEITFSISWIGIICYTIQIYFDFSGYSDMAIGLGRMFGFHFLENFNYPYISRSVQEFWRRWHISLSNWFKDYLYIPLGGNRHGKVRTYINLVTIFLLCGLWHGASWTFVLWGVWYGAFLVCERIFLSNLINKLPVIIQHIYTLLIVLLGWVLFRSDSLSFAIEYTQTLLFLREGTSHISMDVLLPTPTLLALIAGVIGSTPFMSFLSNYLKNITENSKVMTSCYNVVSLSFIYLVFFLSVISLASGIYNPFIYFKF